MPQLCFLEWVDLPLGYSGAVTYIFSKGNVNFLCGSVLCAQPGNVHLCGVQQGGSTSLPSVYCSVTQQGMQGLTLLVSTNCKWHLALVTILFLADTQVLTEALCQHTDLPNFGFFFFLFYSISLSLIRSTSHSVFDL